MPERRWTEEHGADGLRRKFDVYKSRDATTVDLNGMLDGGRAYPAESRIGADSEFVFVLRPETDREAYDALKWYAHYIAYRAPDLADQMNAELRRIEEKNRA